MKKKSGKNVYEKKITLGRDENGMPIRKSITGRTIAELNERIEQAKQNFLKMNSPSSGIDFRHYANQWYEVTKGVRSINTKRMYREILDRYIIPQIGDYYIVEITASDLQAIINAHSAKYETCNKIRLTLRQVFAKAVDDGLLTSSVAFKLVLPPKSVTEKRALTDNEVDALFVAEMPTEHAIFAKLLYYTGLRREEALALTKNDLDFRTKMVTVNKTIVFDGNNPVVQTSTKSQASTRTVPIPSEFIPDIKEYAEQCDNILFSQPRNPGQYISKSSYNKFWKTIITALAKIEPSAADLTAHMFRHTYATLLYYSEVSPKMAARLLGHSDIQMIMRIYAHLDEKKEKTSEKLDAIFNKRKDKKDEED